MCSAILNLLLYTIVDDLHVSLVVTPKSSHPHVRW